MKIIAIVLIILSLYCCTTNVKIVGKYASKETPNCFQFKDDSTFIYVFRKFHLYEYSTGSWRKIKNNRIEINSTIKNTILPLKTLEHGIGNLQKSELSIVLRQPTGIQLKDYKCEIYINDNFYDVKRCDSLSFVQINTRINSIYLKFFKDPVVVTTDIIYLPIITEKYEVKSNSVVNLVIEVSIDNSLFSYKTFNNELIKVKKGSIKYYYNRKWQQITKVSNDSKIFIGF